MTTRLKAELEKHIQKWMDQNCEEDDWPITWIYPEIVEDMALAAWLVLDASRRGQDFKDDQTGGT